MDRPRFYLEVTTDAFVAVKEITYAPAVPRAGDWVIAAAIQFHIHRCVIGSVFVAHSSMWLGEYPDLRDRLARDGWKVEGR